MKSATGDIDVFAIPGFREPVNCFAHFVAVFVFSILSFYLIRQGRGSWLRTASLGVMAFSSVFLLSMSTVYHLLGPGTGRDVMRQLDIAGVFALIAGTMTPIHAILDRGFKRWASLFLVWLAAVTGITLRTVFSEGLPSGVGIAIFLLFGWLTRWVLSFWDRIGSSSFLGWSVRMKCGTWPSLLDWACTGGLCSNSLTDLRMRVVDLSL